MGESFDVAILKQAIEKLIAQGTAIFYCGMAVGFDLIAAAQVLECKKDYPFIKLVACVPCPGQDKYYSLEQKKRYACILKQCDEVITVSDKYYDGCMLARDRYMVDCCDKVIAYLDGRNEGGTAYTVRYARAQGKQIYII